MRSYQFRMRHGVPYECVSSTRDAAERFVLSVSVFRSDALWCRCGAGILLVGEHVCLNCEPLLQPKLEGIT